MSSSSSRPRDRSGRFQRRLPRSPGQSPTPSTQSGRLCTPSPTPGPSNPRPDSPVGSIYHSPNTPAVNFPLPSSEVSSEEESIPNAPPRPPPLKIHPINIHRMTTAAPVKSAKLNIGDLKFSGDKARFREWKDNVDLYMVGNPEQFSTDQKKVTFAMSYLAGSSDIRLWRSARQKEYTVNGWPTWAEFEAALEKDFGDPAAESKAREYLRTFRQGNTPACKFFSNLELWLDLADITDDAERMDVARKAMNPTLRSSLTMIGFPKKYVDLKKKMIDLEDEEKKMETTVNPATLDSRLASHGSTSYQRRPPSDTYRVQGHVPAQPPKRSTKEILAMPKGTRPRPRQPCFTCQRLGRTDMWHW